MERNLSRLKKKEREIMLNYITQKGKGKTLIIRYTKSSSREKRAETMRAGKNVQLQEPLLDLFLACYSVVIRFKRFLFLTQSLSFFVAEQWWPMPLIPALGRQRQVDLCEFKASLIYKLFALLSCFLF